MTTDCATHTAGMNGPGQARFDSDPDALAWARARIAPTLRRLREFERAAADQGDELDAHRWRGLHNMLTIELCGGGGPIMAAFDPRIPAATADALAVAAS